LLSGAKNNIELLLWKAAITSRFFVPKIKIKYNDDYRLHCNTHVFYALNKVARIKIKTRKIWRVLKKKQPFECIERL
jgi:hypothetical protein